MIKTPSAALHLSLIVSISFWLAVIPHMISDRRPRHPAGKRVMFRDPASTPLFIIIPGRELKRFRCRQRKSYAPGLRVALSPSPLNVPALCTASIVA
ncbi:hypothetical protein C8Q74DRAFT_330144 [Fomes fomentarius]|nr:hypothetical protein C8Q74DRAFT_330144 [Fomes fomentarius]